MNEIFGMIREIKSEIFKSVVLESFLDSILVFLGFLLVLRLVNFYPLLAIIPAAAVLIYLVIKRMKLFRLKSVEDRNPLIREMLRTAADNADGDNFVIRALNTELMQKMRQVTSSSLMKLNHIMYKLGGVVVLSILIIYISATQFMLLDLNGLIHNPNPNVKEGSLSDILGDKQALPKIGNNPVDIKLNPLSYEVNIDKIQQAQPKEFKGQFPDEVVAVQEKSYEENIPIEQQIIIKNYFASISQT